eukprot:TRINITY_DN1129_c0_g3_i1.p1 TRINITY_DN1129_c0_g3~~TRINITY_DN1129_c0_g3_i1.p1  ORF type:complete len:374 (-),score=90.89 TRINITY_DN1129_c0_g3_i1:129-1250(-)
MYSSNSSSSKQKSFDYYSKKQQKPHSKQKREKVPPPQTYRPPLFEVDNPESAEAALQFLRDNGYVVYRDVISPDEVQEGLKLLWDFLEGMGTGIKRDDPSTWGDDRWPPGGRTGVIYTHYVGQSPFLWTMRAKPKIGQLYSQIWGRPVEDLLTSFDGCGVMRPTSYDPEWKTNGSWYHLDQNGLKKKGDCCYQGLLNLIDNLEDDPGIVVVPESNHKFSSFFSLIDTPDLRSRGDFVSIKPHYLTNHFKAVPLKLCIPAGSFVVWNSKTVHCNTPALTPRPIIPPHDVARRKAVTLERAVAYVCMSPRPKNPKVLEDLLWNKTKAIRSGVTTNHWPDEFTPARAPPANSAPPPPFVDITPKLSDYQKRLGGII